MADHIGSADRSHCSNEIQAGALIFLCLYHPLLSGVS